jgi:hypothetical protein
VSDELTADRRADRGPGGDAEVRWRRALGRHGPRWWLGLLVAVACAGLAVLYYRQSLTGPFTSDGAGNVLQGQAIAAGNPLLRGWWSSDVSFYSTELPVYALVTAIRGLSPDVVHICGALTYTLIVLLTALTARGRSRGAAGYYRAGIAAGMTIALSVTGSIGLYLENPDHAGTVVPVLVLLLLLDRAEGRPACRAAGGWLVPAAACVLLAAADVGDKLILAVATLPLVIVCAARLTTGSLTAGGVPGGERRGELRLDRRLLLAAVVSTGLAELANLAMRALGGFVLRPVNGVAFAPLSVPAHARLLWQAIVILFGANQPGATHQPQLISAHLPVALMAGFHVIGLLLGAAGLAVGLAALRSRQAGRATQVLVVAVLAIVAFGAFTTLVQSRSYFHEVAPLLPLSAALAGRVLVPPAARWLPVPLRRYPWLPGLALGAWLALTVAELGYTATWPARTPPQQSVAAWLVSHHERAGLAGYFQATSTTVTSGGQVLVAGITLPAGAAAGQPASDRPAAYRWESSADWYQPARHDATFVIAVADPAASGGLPVPAVRASFGSPVAQYRVGSDIIMLYGYNLLTRLAPATFPG